MSKGLPGEPLTVRVLHVPALPAESSASAVFSVCLLLQLGRSQVPLLCSFSCSHPRASGFCHAQLNLQPCCSCTQSHLHSFSSLMELHVLCSCDAEVNCVKMIGHHQSVLIFLSILAIKFFFLTVVKTRRQ